MTPMPQLKINELADELSALLIEEKRADMDMSRLETGFKRLLSAHPQEANAALALMYTHYHRQKDMALHYHKMAIACDEVDPVSLYNYASALCFFDEFDDARTYVTLALEKLQERSRLLEGIAALAYQLHAQDIFHKIIEKANAFHMTSKEILWIASDIALANAESDEDVLQILSDADQRTHTDGSPFGHVLEIDEDRWQRMKALADELR